MNKNMLVSMALVGGVLTGCSTEPTIAPPVSSEQTHEPTQESVQPDVFPPNSLPPSIEKAAKAIVSIVSYDKVTLTKDSVTGKTVSLGRTGGVSYGSGVHIGNGYVITANHLGNAAGEPNYPGYNCLGQELESDDNGSVFRLTVDSASSNATLLGDMAIVHTQNPNMNQRPKIDIAPPSFQSDDEQEVYLVNYQSTDTGESSTTMPRSPHSADTEWTTPAIFSGIAKRSALGEWIIVTGKTITKEYGSGNPQRLTPGGSGGALLNKNGELLAITTYERNGVFADREQVAQMTKTHFTSLDPNGRYWVSGGPAVDTKSIKTLTQSQQDCLPDDNDTVTIK